MVLGVVLGGDDIAHTACHGHGTEASCTDERIYLLLGKKVPRLHHEDTGSDTQRKGTEATGHDAQCLHVDEGIHGHCGTHAESQEDGGGIHHTV